MDISFQEWMNEKREGKSHEKFIFFWHDQQKSFIIPFLKLVKWEIWIYICLTFFLQIFTI